MDRDSFLLQAPRSFGGTGQKLGSDASSSSSPSSSLSLPSLSADELEVRRKAAAAAAEARCVCVRVRCASSAACAPPRPLVCTRLLCVSPHLFLIPHARSLRGLSSRAPDTGADGVRALEGMGFSHEEASHALLKTGGNVQEAAALLAGGSAV